jgi:hypothetical protein
MAPTILWHELFGLLCADFLTDTPFGVRAEWDPCLKARLLRLAIVRTSEAPFAGRLPDGLDNLARHNLFIFRSFQEVLDPWALNELLAHFVEYRKQVSRSRYDLLD